MEPTESPVTENETTAAAANTNGNDNLGWWIVIIILAIFVLVCFIAIVRHQMELRKKNRAVSFDHGHAGTDGNRQTAEM